MCLTRIVCLFVTLTGYDSGIIEAADQNYILGMPLCHFTIHEVGQQKFLSLIEFVHISTIQGTSLKQIKMSYMSPRESFFVFKWKFIEIFHSL